LRNFLDFFQKRDREKQLAKIKFFTYCRATDAVFMY